MILNDKPKEEAYCFKYLMSKVAVVGGCVRDVAQNKCGV